MRVAQKQDKQSNPHRERPRKTYSYPQHHHTGRIGANSLTAVCTKPPHSLSAGWYNNGGGEKLLCGSKCPPPTDSYAKTSTIYTCNYGVKKNSRNKPNRGKNHQTLKRNGERKIRAYLELQCVTGVERPVKLPSSIHLERGYRERGTGRMRANDSNEFDSL